MKSLVYDLIKEVYDSKSSITELLRKAYVIAKKLKIKEFENWIIQELNGYSHESVDDIPDYRIITGKIKAWNPYRGWIPVLFEDTEIDEILSNKKVNQPISEIENLVNSDTGSLAIMLPASVIQQLSKGASMYTDFQLHFGKSQANRIIDIVRNIVLEWSLKLEEDGILGEEMAFSEEEKELASQKGYTVNNFYGPVNTAQIQSHTSSSSQIHVEMINLQKVSELVRTINEHLPQINITENEQVELKKSLDAIVFELKEVNPSRHVIKESLKSIRNIIEGVTGSLIASGLQFQIQQILSA